MSSNSLDNGIQPDLSTEPDPDTIKMFVGQVPRTWNEAECRELFEEFGPVYQLNVLRDKSTQASRGCCFVTFYHRQDAINAQNTLHNLRTLPEMNHAVQMKPADVENRNERKLFVGMLNKTMSEDDVRKLFKEFGQIEECTVLREDGKSRGCAFVTFISRSCAHNAIKQMHQSKTMEGCSKPIVVKFADTQREKDKKQGSSTGSESMDQNALLSQLVQQQQKGGNTQNSALASQLMGLNALLQQPGILNLIGTVPNAQQLQLNALIQQQKMAELLRQGNQAKDANFNLTSNTLYLPSQSQQVVTSNPQFSGISLSPPAANILPTFNNIQQSHQTSVFNTSQYEDVLLASKNPNSLSTFAQQFAAGIPTQLDAYNTATQSPQPTASFGQQLSALNPSSLNLLAQQQQRALAAAASSISGSGAQLKGPENANIFIYHLPQDFTDSDLYQLFSHFGNILSANVFIDKQTNLSKCFGFVSYDNTVSAQNAIAAMNGFQVSSKRLKVQLKQPKPKPYQQPSTSKQSNTNNYVTSIQQ